MTFDESSEGPCWISVKCDASHVGRHRKNDEFDMAGATLMEMGFDMLARPFEESRCKLFPTIIE